MIVKRKLDDAMDEPSSDQEICKFDATVPITCQKSGGLHLAEWGFMAGSPADKA